MLIQFSLTVEVSSELGCAITVEDRAQLLDEIEQAIQQKHLNNGFDLNHCVVGSFTLTQRSFSE